MKKQTKLDKIDEASKESFPTSDPPAWTLGTNQEAKLGRLAESNEVANMLIKEHRAIKKALHVIHELVLSVNQGKSINQTTLANIVTFFREFVDLCHHQKEEMLFPLLNKGDTHPSSYLLKDLKHEHEVIKELVGNLYRAIGKLTDAQIVPGLKDLHFIYTNHMAKEEEYVLPFIHKVLSQKEQDAFLKACEKINNKIGAQQYEQFCHFAE